MVGTATVTPTDLGGGYTKYAIAWVSDGSGDVNGNSFNIKRGRLHRAKFVPDGTAVPTAAYDVTVTDPDGVDVLFGVGANLSATTATIVAPFIGDGTNYRAPPLLEAAAYDPVVANAGAAKEGTIELIVGP